MSSPSRRRARNRRNRARISTVVSLVMAAGLLFAMPVSAAADLTDPKPNRSVPGADGLKAKKPKPDPADKAAMRAPAKVSWPKAGSAVADLTRSQPGDRVRAGDLPVHVVAGEDTPAKVEVELTHGAAAAKAGATGGLLIKATRIHETNTPRKEDQVELEVDTSAFSEAFGGDYASRLRITRMPDCAATTPGKAGCIRPQLLETARDKAGQLSAELTFPATSERTTDSAATESVQVLAVTAGASGDAGDFTATGLSPSATWQVSTQSGDFSWSYPMRTPPVPGGLKPQVGVDYSSGSVDGRTAATNNQASQLGEGFDYWPGFIERSYKPCFNDGHSLSGDLCWGYDNVTLSLNGRAGELVKDDDGKGWHLKNDDGTRIEHKTGATGNGDDNGEHWIVTTPDGTRYFFGKHQLPGYTSGKAVTNSAWKVPVFGDDANEPCNDSTFASSWCYQAWRWNLDLVIDPHGNAMSYWYGQETNYYGRNFTASAGTEYVRGGYLKRIDYGMRGTDVYTGVPAQGVLTPAERCIVTETFACGATQLNASTASHWPDVPYDQNCNSGETCTNRLAPTFWTTKRVAAITTQVWNPSISAYRKVESWALKHTFPLPGDGTAPALWLEEITHTGLAGGTVELPKVKFSGDAMDNRVDAMEGLAPLKRWRITSVESESGGELSVAYMLPECARSALPSPDSNTKRCFPAYWTPEGEQRCGTGSTSTPWKPSPRPTWSPTLQS